MVGENITTTCVTTDSAFMAWSSDEYIGQGLRWEYTLMNLSGSVHTSVKHPSTFANLTKLMLTHQHLFLNPNCTLRHW